MSTPKNKYHLEQVSNGCKAEFETFKNEQDKLHYFHFNDEDGQALLYSQGYKEARSRQNAIQSLEKNIHQVEQRRDGAQHYFVIRSANKQEFARSRNFDAIDVMTQAIQQMQQMITAGATIGAASGTQQKTPAPPVQKPSNKTASKEAHQPARYRFSLELQRRGENDAFTGRIEYPVTGEEAIFKSIDLAAIQAFITRFAKPAPAKAAPSAVLPKAEYLNLIALQNGETIEDNNLQSEAALELRMNVANQGVALSANTMTFLAKVHARSLESGSRTMIGQRQGFVSETGDIAVPALLSSLSPGSYRLVTDVDLHVESRIRHLEGSRLVHITG